MKDLEEVLFCLVMQITWNKEEKNIKLGQKRYIEYILTHFGMENSKLVNMPLDSNTKLTKDETPMHQQELEKMKHVPYRQAVGYFMYAMVGTQPGIATVVGIVSQFMEESRSEHQRAVKCILRYLQGSKEYWIHYFERQFESSNKMIISGSCDFNWGGDLDTR